MPIAISDDHSALAETARDLLANRDARGAARELLDGKPEELPALWSEFAEMGWLGIHLPEEHGGQGFGIDALVVVVEELGRAIAPGPFVPTVIASAVIDAIGDDVLRKDLLPRLADGSLVGAVALGGSVTVKGDKASGSAGPVLGGTLAQLFVVAAGDDVAIVEKGDGVTVETPTSLDPTRTSAKVTLDGASATVIKGARRTLTDLARVILSAEAVGLSAQATEDAAAYAKERKQFGRPIAMFQAVKHHCANMVTATELTTAAVWDAARAAETGGDQLTYAAAVAATLAAPTADECANLNTQVHGGIAITWEHDAHLFMRRATTLLPYLDSRAAAEDVVDLVRKGIRREKAVELPPEAEDFRGEVREFAQSIKDLQSDEQREKLIETGYVLPHWPKPYGRDASAIEQLVIEQEFNEAGIKRPSYGITGWNILTIIQHGTQEQAERWVMPVLRQELTWCQLFSEPDAGSDAAAVKTKAEKVDGGWVVNGQKVWTSGARESKYGFATVRTDPEAQKHAGITMMVIDMEDDGVEIRPLKMTTGGSSFNEVFFNDVFVPESDVVGAVNDGWTVARATLGNESVSIGGGGGGGMEFPGGPLVAAFDANPERLEGGASRVGRFCARDQALGLINLRSVFRAVAGAESMNDGAITKLVIAENGHESVAIQTELNGGDVVFTDGPAAMSNMMVLLHRAMSIAGGTSEIKRNQIGERILGLPRDPLVK